MIGIAVSITILLFLPGLAELVDAGFGDFVPLDHLDVLPDDATRDAREETDLGETLPIFVELINTFEVGEVGINCIRSVVDAARDFLSQQSLELQFDRLAFMSKGRSHVVHRATEGEQLLRLAVVVLDAAADRGLTHAQ